MDEKVADGISAVYRALVANFLAYFYWTDVSREDKQSSFYDNTLGLGTDMLAEAYKLDYLILGNLPG